MLGSARLDFLGAALHAGQVTFFKATHTGARVFMPPVPFILIADDFGLSKGISDAILDLLSKNRLSGTGSMVNQPGWAADAVAFKPFMGQRDLGLHLTLTLGAPLGLAPTLAPEGQFLPLSSLMAKCFLNGIPRREFRDEIIRQIEAFKAATGRFPDFIDGHQHVHVLPVIRRALFEAVEIVNPQRKPWLRVPSDHVGSIMARGVSIGKALFISLLSTGFAREAKRHGYRVNDTFSGVRSFDPHADFAREFQRFLLVNGKRHLVMCHPGVSDAALAAIDPVTTARDQEYEFFKSDEFESMLSAFSMRVSRFDEL